jgi:hypothetical protein
MTNQKAQEYTGRTIFKDLMLWCATDMSSLQITGPDGEIIVIVDAHKSEGKYPVFVYPESSVKFSLPKFGEIKP